MKSQDLRSAEGKGLVGCTIFIVLAAVAILVGIRLIPVYYANYSLEGEVKTEASRAGAQKVNDEQVVKDIIAVGKENDISLDESNITIKHVTYDQIQIDVDYTVPVNFFIIERDFNFVISEKSFVGQL